MSIAIDLNAAVWRKSSYSNGEGGACLEVVDRCPGAVPVRDSKMPDGAVLLLTHQGWATFVQSVKHDVIRQH
ncbi:DUF397 domain-containing protein [Streptomyces sp. NBC_00963]|uniref:DUF397 domain-containing protein n=1 Tax=Streptomyces sp. NBC_00963 TaxID=2903697 RepID=UPI003863754A|nr:DUF397 domain-containing protein [Streptomyces sp. NBC_00963]